MKHVLQIDSDGYFIVDMLIQDDDPTPADCVETLCPEGFYTPKWDGTSWTEGKPQSEIDALKVVEDAIPPELADIQSATTIAQLRTAILNFLTNGGGI